MLSQKLLEFSMFGAEWVLWVLIALSGVSLALAVDRLILFVKTREQLPLVEPRFTAALGKNDYATAASAIRGDSLVRNVLRAGVDLLASGTRSAGTVEQAMLGALARERARYDARLTPLGTIGNNAPFVGLFGTVLGIIQAFRALEDMDPSAGSTNQFVMGAIGEALVATGVGILVAIPAVAIFNSAKSHINGRVRQAESMMGAVMAHVHDRSAGGRSAGGRGAGEEG